MAISAPSRAELSADRFTRRQIEWALTQHKALPASDPWQRSRRWLLVSLVLGVSGVIAAGVLAVVRPEPDWRAAAILLDTDSGSLFVNRDGVLHPALNFASALLVADPTGFGRRQPTSFRSAALRDAPRGEPLGIPDAPGQVPADTDLIDGGWAICDQTGTGGADVTSTALIGVPAPASPLPASAAILATSSGADGGTPVDAAVKMAGGRPADAAVETAGGTPAGTAVETVGKTQVESAGDAPAITPVDTAGGTSVDTAVQTAGATLTNNGGSTPVATAVDDAEPGTAYLIWNGLRAPVDLANPVVVQALRLQGAQPRLLSPALLTSFPEGPAIAAPAVVGRGEATSGFTVLTDTSQPLVVGDVFQVDLAGTPPAFFVIQRDGVAQVTALVADLIRFSSPAAGSLRRVEPSEAVAAPVSTAAGESPPMAATRPDLVADRARTLCAIWDPQFGAWTAAAGPALSEDAPEVAARRSNDPVQVDRVLVTRGRGAIVRRPSATTEAAGPVGVSDGTDTGAQIYLITETGTAYPVDDTALARFGVTSAPQEVPSHLIEVLPRGPVLTVEAAQQEWGSAGPDSTAPARTAPARASGPATAAPGTH